MREIIKFILIFISFTTCVEVFAQELSPEQIYEKVNNCVVVIHSFDFSGKLAKQGSGVVISEKGWIVTNYHVYDGCERMEVKHNDKIVKFTDVIGFDVDRDILILKIKNNMFPSISLANSDYLKVGQRVYAIGSPLGLENSISEGIISGLRNIDYNNRNYIQITASISPGSSGGAVVNSLGELIGISTMERKGGQNLNFAIPINDILSISPHQNISKKDINATTLFSQGLNAMEAEDYEKAINYFNDYLEIYPNDLDALYNRGFSFYKINKPDLVIKDLNKFIAIKNDDSEVYNLRGLAYIDWGWKSKSEDLLKERSDIALTDFIRAVELDANYAEPYFNLAKTYRRHPYMMIDKAIYYYSKAIQVDNTYFQAYYYRAHCYFDNKQYYDAINDLTFYIKNKPKMCVAYILRGNCYYELKNYKEALNNYDMAINISPNGHSYYYDRGFAKLNLLDLQGACSDFQQSAILGFAPAKDALNKYCR